MNMDVAQALVSWGVFLRTNDPSAFNNSVRAVEKIVITLQELSNSLAVLAEKELAKKELDMKDNP